MSAPENDAIEIPQIANLSNVNVNAVHAELVRASRSAIRNLEAEEADVSNAVVGTAATGKFSGRQTIVGAVNAQLADLREAYVGGARGESLSVSGKTALMVAATINAPQVKAGIAVGAQINAENIRAGLLIGRKINGNVQTLVDGRAAIAAGVLGGMIAGLVMLAGKLLIGRKK